MRDFDVSVMGLGTIGTKLVVYFLSKGQRVIALTRSVPDSKYEKLAGILRKKYPDGAADLIKNLHVTNDMGEMVHTRVGFDSTLETYDSKRSLYERMREVLNRDQIIATTTSSLDLNRLSGYCAPLTLVGFHVFNPPDKMKLVEINLPENCSEDVIAAVDRVKNVMDDKVFIHTPRIQGYICNRLLFIYINAAFDYHLTTGISFSDIDKAMELGTNVPMGPFKLSDYVGNDVTLSILEQFHEELGDERYKPSRLIIQLVKEGKLGKKTGRGFYDHS